MCLNIPQDGNEKPSIKTGVVLLVYFKLFNECGNGRTVLQYSPLYPFGKLLVSVLLNFGNH